MANHLMVVVVKVASRAMRKASPSEVHPLDRASISEHRVRHEIPTDCSRTFGIILRRFESVEVVEKLVVVVVEIYKDAAYHGSELQVIQSSKLNVKPNHLTCFDRTTGSMRRTCETMRRVNTLAKLSFANLFL